MNTKSTLDMVGHAYKDHDLSLLDNLVQVGVVFAGMFMVIWVVGLLTTKKTNKELKP